MEEPGRASLGWGVVASDLSRVPVPHNDSVESTCSIRLCWILYGVWMKSLPSHIHHQPCQAHALLLKAVLRCCCLARLRPGYRLDCLVVLAGDETSQRSNAMPASSTAGPALPPDVIKAFLESHQMQNDELPPMFASAASIDTVCAVAGGIQAACLPVAAGGLLASCHQPIQPTASAAIVLVRTSCCLCSGIG